MSMRFRRWFRARPGRRTPDPVFRPVLTPMEDRTVPSAAINVLQTNLVSDLPGVAQFQDPNLVNPWGISESSGGPFWISDNNSGRSTLYDTAGTPQSLVVSIPSPGDPTGASGTPTGTVFNTTLGGAAPGFVVSSGGKSAPAVFLFATEDGTIAGWAPSVDGTHAIIAVDNSANPNAASGAVYKGLTIATDANGRTLLYASNFRAGTVEVYDTSFKLVTTLPAGAFTDPNLKKGYAPFDVQALGGKIYVTYALQNADKHDDVAGAHHGFVDVFNLDGTPGLAGGKMRLESGGALDSPWGLALAPAGFDNVGGDLLVGNFGDGRINVFDPVSGAFQGQLKDPDGETIRIDGLWGLKFGNGGKGGDAGTLYFTAGIDHEQHGLFGSLAPAAAGSPEGQSEEQSVQIAFDVFQNAVTTLEQDEANGASKATIRQDFRNLEQALDDLVRAETAFVRDEHEDHEQHSGSDAKSPDNAAALDLRMAESLVIDLRHMAR
jgi:uncharacterized protein (TIGR03118 family)